MVISETIRYGMGSGRGNKRESGEQGADVRLCKSTPSISQDEANEVT
jgi:hypothetical protein